MSSKQNHDSGHETSALTAVSVVVPTFHEANNLAHLIRRIDQLPHDHHLQIELLIVDDDSRDGTVELIESLDLDWIRLIVRPTDRGLSQAVVEGLRQAQHEVVVVMDADLSHPPEIIPKMLQMLDDGQEFVIGSRYVPGGSTDTKWGLFRWVVSKTAILLARPFTKLRDPMAGFFALRRNSFEKTPGLNPVGYKIALELIVKCGFTRVTEIPIHFTERQRGKSKLTLREQMRYLKHLYRLFLFKYRNTRRSDINDEPGQ